MKLKFYPFVNGCIVFIIAISFSSRAQAQCQCQGNVTPNTIVHAFQLDSVTLPTDIYLPKFNMSTGTLACVQLAADITTILSFDLVNKVSTPFVYEMKSDITSSITGPAGLRARANSEKDYGPFDLDAYQAANDSIRVTDTIFRNVHDEAFTSNVTDYMGTGDVRLRFAVSGPVWADPSSGNYGCEVKTYSYVNITLTYHWCESQPLATNITYFSATLRGNTTDLVWNVTNEEISNSYEIETSYDGRRFFPAGQVTSQYAAEGAAAKYHYQYVPDQAAAGKLFFRIKQKDGKGNARYSNIRVVSLNPASAGSWITYPNPVTDKKVTFQFDRTLNGSFALELISLSGQVLHQQTVKVAQSNLLPVALPHVPPPGLYYLRAKDLSAGHVYTSKIMMGAATR